MPELTIITINLNNVLGLKKTIDSVLMQTFVNYEYIIIYGASKDGSVELIKKYSDRITFWISEQDAGIYSAMNKGIRKASGEYCLFLNSGDWLYNENVLENVFRIKFTEDIVYGIQLLQEGKEIIETKTIDPEYITFRSFIETSLPHQSSFIKTENFHKIGLYNENNKIVSDWEWSLIAIFKYNCNLKNLSLYISVIDTQGISNCKKMAVLHKNERRISLISNFPRIIPDYYDFQRIQNKRYFKFYYWLREIKNRTFR